MASVKEDVERTFKRCLGGVLRTVGHSKAMSNIEIKNITTKIIGKEKFIGVYALGEIDINESKTPGTCYILNNKVRSSGGEHWLSIFYDSTGEPILLTVSQDDISSLNSKANIRNPIRIRKNGKILVVNDV